MRRALLLAAVGGLTAGALAGLALCIAVAICDRDLTDFPPLAHHDRSTHP